MQQDSVNKVSQKKTFPNKSKQFKGKQKKGYFCGSSYPHSGVCPAKDKKCNYCQKLGHFEKCCHSKDRDQKDKPKTVLNQSKTKSAYSVQAADAHFDSDTSEEYTFHIGKPNKTPSAIVTV